MGDHHSSHAPHWYLGTLLDQQVGHLSYLEVADPGFLERPISANHIVLRGANLPIKPLECPFEQYPWGDQAE
jgi:hypothetical protein